MVWNSDLLARAIIEKVKEHTETEIKIKHKHDWKKNKLSDNIFDISDCKKCNARRYKKHGKIIGYHYNK